MNIISNSYILIQIIVKIKDLKIKLTVIPVIQIYIQNQKSSDWPCTICMSWISFDVASSKYPLWMTLA